MAQPDNSATIASLAAQLKGSGGGGSTNFIGFPAGVSSLQGVGTDTSIRQPLYGDGSEWIPVRSNATPAEISQLQDQLYAAGLLTSDYRAGVWDTPSMTAFKQVLGLANASGTTWQDALTNYVNNGTQMVWDPKTNSYVKGTPGASKANTLVTNFTNPDDLATTANTVAQAKIGRSFTPDELQRFVKAYHDTEALATAAQNAAGAGGSYTEAPAADVAAATFAQQTDPTAYNAEQFLPLVQKMNDLLSGPGLNTTAPLAKPLGS